MLHSRSTTAVWAGAFAYCLAFFPAAVSAGAMDESGDAEQRGHPDPNVVLPDTLLQAVIVKPGDIDAQLRPALSGKGIGAGCEARLPDDFQTVTPPPRPSINT